MKLTTKFVSGVFSFAILLLAIQTNVYGKNQKVVPFFTAEEAYRQGMAAFRGGSMELAIPALNYASDSGYRYADLPLARIYQEGIGIPRDDEKAYYHYKQYAYKFAAVSSDHHLAADVANAFVALGLYQLKGIPESTVRKDPRLAFKHFKHAAANLKDPVAGFQLARMYQKGEGTSKNLRMAARWFNFSYKKNHTESQAILGNLFWRGIGVPRNRAIGLALLKIANENAGDTSCPGYSGGSQRWIEKAFQNLNSAADPNTSDSADQYFTKLYRPCDRSNELPSINGILIKNTPDQGSDPGLNRDRLQETDRPQIANPDRGRSNTGFGFTNNR